MGKYSRTLQHVANSVGHLRPRKNGGLLLFTLRSTEKKHSQRITEMDQKHGVHCW